MDAVTRTAFHQLVPISDRYATLPVSEAFTWDACLADVPPGDWYMVAFRSIRRPDADEARLTAYDEWAHTEAMQAPGFVHYLKGPADVHGRCMSFCLWTSRHEARAAAGRPAHVRAAALTFESYAHYSLEFHRVRRTAGGSFTFEPYDLVATETPLNGVPTVASLPAADLITQPAAS